MGMLLSEQNFRDVWSRNESVWAEIGQILHTQMRRKLVAEIRVRAKLELGLGLKFDPNNLLGLTITTKLTLNQPN